MYGALFSPPPHKSLGTKLLAVVLSEGTCQELEPKWLHPIVDHNTVEQVVGLVVYKPFVPLQYLMSGCIKEATTVYSNPECVVIRQQLFPSCLEKQQLIWG